MDTLSPPARLGAAASPLSDWCPPAKRLMIAIPAYTETVSDYTVASLFASQGIDFQIDVRTISRDPYIHRARNALVTEFLQGEATDLLFLDSDVGFDPTALARIGHAEKPFVAGVYPKKTDGELDFPLDILPGIQATDMNGLLEVRMVPTGFLRLNRSVFEHMPYEIYRGTKGQVQFGYFDTFLGGGEFIGEDVRFCRQWRERGGKIWLLPDITFQHLGFKTWEGNFHQHLLKICQK